MKRRDFIKTTALASAPILFNGMPVMASSKIESKQLDALANATLNCGKVLVIIQMNGGNDGLNTVFPKDKYNNLFNARENILLPQSSILPLNNNSTTGFHPAMSGLKNLYDDGKMMIVQAVSYPNPNLSHFRATDIWFTASGSNQVLDSGWLGRSLETIYPGYPTSYPNLDMPDPLAIQIGSTLPFSLQGNSINMGYNVPNPNTLLNVINGITDPTPNSDYGKELSFLRLMKDQSNAYRTGIQTAYNFPLASPVAYPTGNSLATQLQIVAKLVNGGLKTPIYIVNHQNSFDTHENQVNVTDKTTGRHAASLTALSQAITAFQQDLTAMGKADLVTGMTFSEFGRRIKSNDSIGTDHGTAAPVLFFGAALNTNPNDVASSLYPVAGMIGTSPNLPLYASTSSQIPLQFDYRQLYSSIMQDWLCMTETETNNVLGGVYPKLPIFKNTLLSSTDFNNLNNNFVTLFPNPVTNDNFNLKFDTPINTNIKVSVYSIQGSLIYSEIHYVSNDNLKINTNFASNSEYIVEIEYNNQKFFKKIIVN
jgi:uncharacterized protein (DUF1501 family)